MTMAPSAHVSFLSSKGQTYDKDHMARSQPSNHFAIVRCACQVARALQAARLMEAFGIGELCAALVVLSSLHWQFRLWLEGIFVGV